jgi:hypothetical protein
VTNATANAVHNPLLQICRIMHLVQLAPSLRMLPSVIGGVGRVLELYHRRAPQPAP